MNLRDTIDAHVRALPPELQREVLMWIEGLEQRRGLVAPPPGGLTTEAFIERLAGSISDDFPDDIDDLDVALDAPRETVE